jgi:transposase
VAHLVTADEQAAVCPSCQQMSTSPKGYVTTRPRDLPHGGRGVQLMWRKRRWRCRNPGCGRGSFTESVASVPARHRLTTRLRGSAGAAVADRGATVEQAGRDHGLSWPTVWDATRAHAATARRSETERAGLGRPAKAAGMFLQLRPATADLAVLAVEPPTF